MKKIIKKIRLETSQKTNKEHILLHFDTSNLMFDDKNNNNNNNNNNKSKYKN